MAEIVYSFTRGDTKDQVTVGAVDTGADMFVQVDDTKNLRKEEILRGLDTIKQKIFEQLDHN